VHKLVRGVHANGHVLKELFHFGLDGSVRCRFGPVDILAKSCCPNHSICIHDLAVAIAESAMADHDLVERPHHSIVRLTLVVWIVTVDICPHGKNVLVDRHRIDPYGLVRVFRMEF